MTEPKVYCMKGVVLYGTEITYCNILYVLKSTFCIL